MDIGRAYDDKYFINIAAAGSFTELTYSVPSRLKTVLGYLAYLVKGAELLPQVKKVPVRITHDQGVFEGDLSMIFVALTNSVGGFEMIAPDAKLDDGQFTLIMVKTANLFELVDLIRQVLQGGKHIYDKRVAYIKTSSLDIEPLGEDRMMINLDGEYGAMPQFTSKILRITLNSMLILMGFLMMLSRFPIQTNWLSKLLYKNSVQKLKNRK